jgi:hypothetical protein
MLQTLDVLFDGEALIPATPLNIKPGTLQNLYLVTTRTKRADATHFSARPFRFGARRSLTSHAIYLRFTLQTMTQFNF